MRLVSRNPMEPADHTAFPETPAEPEQFRALREFLARPQLEQTAQDLLSILDQFDDAAALDFDREAGRGYLSDVLAGSPNSSREVESLRGADAAVQSRLEGLRRHVGRQLSRRCVSEAVRRQLNDWVQSCTAHRRHENRLVNESLNRDTGGES